MDSRIQNLQTFLDSAHSVYHAVAALAGRLEQEGYSRLRETDAWELVPGGKYYLTRNGSAVVAFRVPAGEPRGFLISASFSSRSSAVAMAALITTHSLKVEAVSATGME